MPNLKLCLRLVALPLFLVILIIGPLNWAMKNWVMKAYNDPYTPAQIAQITPDQKLAKLVEGVDAARVHILDDGEGEFAASCLKKFPRAFKRAESLTGMEQSLLAGVAGYESAGCALPKDEPGNVMHITLSSDRHIVTAARLLGIPKRKLNWRKHSEHSVVLGAVMLTDYIKRTESTTKGLSAYRHGPGKASSAYAGDAYTREVLAHTVLGRRFLLSQEADIPVAESDPVKAALDLPYIVIEQPPRFEGSVAAR